MTDYHDLRPLRTREDEVSAWRDAREAELPDRACPVCGADAPELVCAKGCGRLHADDGSWLWGRSGA